MEAKTAPMAAAISSLRTFTPSRRAVGWWLIAVALLIAAMVTIGGLTRLTGSGLSITEWKPVTGVIPPLSENAWQAEFAKYQRIPQYRLENRGMSLGDFKAIYWWEWSHRFLARLLGFAFLIPLLFFAATGAIPFRGLLRMVVLFALFALQAFVGWWMVESGLETRVSVSQYRLAIHLGVAIILFGAILWTALEYLRDPVLSDASPANAERKLRPWAIALTGLVYAQMLLGALVAGLHAGLIYNTWPSMDGRVLPEHPFFSTPWWINFFENPGLAQFDHRLIAYVVALSVLAIWIFVRRARLSAPIRNASNAVLAVTAFQIVLGILTLLNQVPVALAALHQLTAVALLASTVWLAFEFSKE